MASTFDFKLGDHSQIQYFASFGNVGHLFLLIAAVSLSTAII